MSEHVDVERSEVALLLLEWDVCRDPWESSCFGEWCLLGALPHGSGGRKDDGDPENIDRPLELPPRIGMGLLGAADGTTMGEELGGHPMGTRTQPGAPSENREPGGKYKQV